METNKLNRKIILNDEIISNLHKRIGRLKGTLVPLTSRLEGLIEETLELKKDQFIRDKKVTVVRKKKAPKKRARVSTRERELATMQKFLDKMTKLTPEELIPIMHIVRKGYDYDDD